MDRAFLERLLVQAEWRLTLGERHIARQRGIIAELERDGHDSTQAKELLAVFMATQATRVDGRDRLLKELKLS